MFVDVDGQANLTTALGFNPDEIEIGALDVLTKKDFLTQKAIHKTDIERVELIPSRQEVFTADIELLKRPGGNFVLSDALDQVRDNYDYIFIDTPPTLGAVTLNALIAVNGVVLVYDASDFSLDGLSQILNTLDDIRGNKRLNVNGVQVVGAIMNRHRISNKTVNNATTAALDGVTDIPRYFTSISDSTEIAKAQFEQLPIILYNPRHKITDQFKTFAAELEQWRND